MLLNRGSLIPVPLVKSCGVRCVGAFAENEMMTCALQIWIAYSGNLGL